MTDEEMAEDWIKDHSGLIGSYKFVKYDYDSLKQTFLAGLKAGSPKWHKVADGDLPKNENDVLVYSGEEWRMCIGRYSPKNKAWEAGCDTVAWCEIPEYKGK